MSQQLLSLKGVSSTTTLSKSVIYELIKLGQFPQPIRIPNTRRVAWRADEVEAMINRWAEESGTHASSQAEKAEKAEARARGINVKELRAQRPLKLESARAKESTK